MELAAGSELPPALGGLNVDDLPSPPVVAMEVIRLAQRDDVSVDQVSSVLGKDPALAAKLIRMANSAAFRRGDEVTSLNRAVMMMGLRAVKLLALGLSVAADIPVSGKVDGFDYGLYWRRSLLSAVISRELAGQTNTAASDEAFLCGLLTNLGRVVLVRNMTDDYQPAVDAAPDGWASPALERSVIGLTSDDVTAAVLAHWGLPSVVFEPIQLRDDLAAANADGVDAQIENLAKLLHISSIGETLLCAEEKGDSLDSFYRAANELFAMSVESTDDFLISIESSVTETADVLEVPLENISHREILDQARIQMVTLSMSTAVSLEAEQRRSEELESQATTDALTGLSNRGGFDQFLNLQVHTRLRHNVGQALGLIMIDIDHFKAVNDTYGHQGGDDVLAQVAAHLDARTRASEFAARFGGEEFAVVVPQGSPQDLEVLAERLRAGIEELKVTTRNGEELGVTISVGGACIDVTSPDDGERLIGLADGCLYEAKNAGRNRVSINPDVS